MSKFSKSRNYPQLKELTDAYVALETAHESYKEAQGQCALAKSEFETWRDNTGLRDSRSYGTTLDERFGEYLACSLREDEARITLSAAHTVMTKQLPVTRRFLSRYRSTPGGACFNRKAMVTLDLNFAEACELLVETKIVLDRSMTPSPKPYDVENPHIEAYRQARFDEASEICSRLCGT